MWTIVRRQIAARKARMLMNGRSLRCTTPLLRAPSASASALSCAATTRQVLLLDPSAQCALTARIFPSSPPQQPLYIALLLSPLPCASWTKDAIMSLCSVVWALPLALDARRFLAGDPEYLTSKIWFDHRFAMTVTKARRSRLATGAARTAIRFSVISRGDWALPGG